MKNIEQILNDYNNDAFIGPLDKYVRQSFGEVLDEKIFDNPTHYAVLREIKELESALTLSFRGISPRATDTTDIVVNSRRVSEGSVKSIFVNLNEAYTQEEIPQIPALGVGEIPPYRLGYSVDFSKEGTPLDSRLVFSGAGIINLPKDVAADTARALNSHYSESWKAETVITHSPIDLTKTVTIPFNAGANFQPDLGESKPSNTDLRTKNIAESLGLSWKSVHTPVTVEDLAFIKSGYIIAYRLLQADLSKRR